MKYYVIQHLGTNVKETGTQFQSITGVIGDIQQDFIPYEGKINFSFNLPEPFLQKKAKPTTRIHVALIPGQFQVFKKYFIDLLKDFNIGEFQTWDIIVHHKDIIIYDYELFYLTRTINAEIIDTDTSKFSVGNWSDWEYKGDDISFKTKLDYESKWDEFSNSDSLIIATNLVLDFTSLELDLIRVYKVPILGGHHLVSERLKNAIEKERFTGFSFQEIEEMDDRIKVIY